jgi:hypothetical protein
LNTDCNSQTFLFQPLSKEGKGSRRVEAAFDGGAVTSDGGGLLLREVEAARGILRRFAECFTDHRDDERVEHTVAELVAQRVYGIALGYEDLNDHDTLRHDPLLAVLAGKPDPTGGNRKDAKDRGKALAGKSTLNRLELTPEELEPKARYKKITADTEAMDRLLVDIFLESQSSPPARIVLDLDATDDPLHGDQEGRFFHGYHDCYCYLPLYIFCDDFLLCGRLRRSNIDASEGSVDELKRIVKQIRGAWPETEICIRGDSGFCREEIMAWCETNRVHYVLGIAKNSRLQAEIQDLVKQAQEVYESTGEPARFYHDFAYRTRESWSRSRRVIAKAEHLSKGSNPRFVVTSYARGRYHAQPLYEAEYCARGEMENRIKEQQLYLFADRTSTHQMYSNQLRLYFSTFAYVLLHELRRLGLRGTEMAKAQCHTIRVRLLKIGARVKVTVRRVVVSMANACPFQFVFAAAWENLRRLRLSPT